MSNKRFNKVADGTVAAHPIRVSGDYAYSNIGDIDVAYYMTNIDLIRQDPSELIATSDSINKVRDSISDDDIFRDEKFAFLKEQDERRLDAYNAYVAYGEFAKAVSKLHSFDNKTFSSASDAIGYSDEAIRDIVNDIQNRQRQTERAATHEKSIAGLNVPDVSATGNSYEME